MVSAERVIAYGEDLPSEAPFETDPLLEKPPSTWPESGRIELKDLTYRHSETSPLVLKGLSAVIGSGEKVNYGPLNWCVTTGWLSLGFSILIVLVVHVHGGTVHVFNTSMYMYMYWLNESWYCIVSDFNFVFSFSFLVE